MDLELTDQEQAQLVRYERSREGDRKWLDYYTVEVMIQIWRAVATSVNERDWTPQDYDGAGLMWRSYLQDVIDETEPPLRTRAARTVRLIGARRSFDYPD